MKQEIKIGDYAEAVEKGDSWGYTAPIGSQYKRIESHGAYPNYEVVFPVGNSGRIGTSWYIKHKFLKKIEESEVKKIKMRVIRN